MSINFKSLWLCCTSYRIYIV